MSSLSNDELKELKTKVAELTEIQKEGVNSDFYDAYSEKSQLKSNPTVESDIQLRAEIIKNKQKSNNEITKADGDVLSELNASYIELSNNPKKTPDLLDLEYKLIILLRVYDEILSNDDFEKLKSEYENIVDNDKYKKCLTEYSTKRWDNHAPLPKLPYECLNEMMKTSEEKKPYFESSVKKLLNTIKYLEYEKKYNNNLLSTITRGVWDNIKGLSLTTTKKQKEKTSIQNKILTIEQKITLLKNFKSNIAYYSGGKRKTRKNKKAKKGKSRKSSRK